MTRKAEVEARATGKWQSILAGLGVDENFLTRKHGPCPLCGGKDRYRFTNYQDRGGYVCNQCGPGDGFGLLMAVNDWGFRKALDEVAQVVGYAEDDTKKAPGVDPRMALRKVLEGCSVDREPVREYLAQRGLECCPPALRFHPSLDYFDPDRGHLGQHPAMVAVVNNADGSAQSVHRTYLADVPVRRKMMTPVNRLDGASIRLMPHHHTLAVAEGIETAIAAHEMLDVPAWATVNATMMEKFRPPRSVKHVMVCADNDANFAGQKSAFVLANRLSLDGLAVEVVMPPEPGTDWADWWSIERLEGDAK